MSHRRLLGHSLRGVGLIATIICVSLLHPVFADDKIEWKSERGKQNAVIWRTELPEVGSMAVGPEAVVIGGGDISKRRGYVLCLSRELGKILWQVSHNQLPARIHDMAGIITSTPFIDNDRVYYVSNRGELCCVKLADGHAIWTLDMPQKLGVFKRDPNDVKQLAPSPIVVGDRVYCTTANGSGEMYNIAPAPDAPSFLAVNKLTGKVIWSSNAPGKNISYGQWSTPALATVDGAREILFPGGDGALYAFEPLGGKQLWKINCRVPVEPKDFNPWDSITAQPVVVGETAYVSLAMDFEWAGGFRRLLDIDLHAHAIRWAVGPKNFSGAFGSLAYSSGAIYAGCIAGPVICLDAETGKMRWSRELDAGTEGGICYHDEKLYLITQDGDLLILSSSTGKTIDECNLGFTGVGTPVVDGKRIFVVTRNAVCLLRLPGD